MLEYRKAWNQVGAMVSFSDLEMVERWDTAERAAELVD
jgi:hypothetical protein